MPPLSCTFLKSSVYMSRGTRPDTCFLPSLPCTSLKSSTCAGGTRADRDRQGHEAVGTPGQEEPQATGHGGYLHGIVDRQTSDYMCRFLRSTCVAVSSSTRRRPVLDWSSGRGYRSDCRLPSNYCYML